MRLNEYQKLIWNTYRHHDTKRGLENTFKWFLSEIYELKEAIEASDTNQVRYEIADVLAWLLSVANLLDVNLEKEFDVRYGAGCPKCGYIPCKCPYREKPDKEIKCIKN